MRIAHLAMRYPPALGGAETHVQRIAAAQCAAGHAVHVVTTKLATEVPLVLAPALPDRDMDGAVAVRRLPIRRLVPGLWGYGASPAGLLETLLEIAPDVVHAHGYGYAFSDRLVRRRDAPWRFVLTSHGTFAGRGVLRPLKSAYDATLGRTTLRRADAVVAISPGDASSFRALGCRRVEMVPNGVDAEWFAARPARDVARARLGLSGTVLLEVARLAPHKGHDVAIGALSLLLPSFQDAHLVLVGPDGGAERTLRELAQSGGLGDRVRFLGAVSDEDLRAAYGAADVLVHPAREEGFGIVLLEAMAAEVPVVAARVGGIPFAVGDAAELVAPEAESLAAGVVRLLRDPALRAQRVARGLERVQEFRWRDSAERLLALYAELLRRGTREQSRGRSGVVAR